jgi:hypothetical protein
MDLKEAKKKIKLESANPDTNRYFQNMIQDSEDCFGKNYKETHPECQSCTILANLDDKREPVYIFCKELSEGGQGIDDEKVDAIPYSQRIAEQQRETPVEPISPIISDEWKKLVKALHIQGLPKEEIVAKVMATYPDVKPGKIGGVLNGYRFQKAGVKARQERAQTTATV